MTIQTPYYYIDERKLVHNLRVIRRVRDLSGARSVLATKCFSTWQVFPLMGRYMDGTTSSSVFEARLGHEEFGGETHAYCVGWKPDEVRAVGRFADKVIFNSVSQLLRFRKHAGRARLGLRANPGTSYLHFDLADPARKCSRLGVVDTTQLRNALPYISGLMFHFNCENADFGNLSKNLDRISREYGDILKSLSWVSLGGGLYFTQAGYPVERFCRKLKEFSDQHGVQVYLEPGETAITRSAELVTSVVDIVHNKTAIAIVDASTEAHMLDLLIYRTPAKMDNSSSGRYAYTVAGRSCLAGDVFGTYRFKRPLKVGSVLRIADAAGYSMVKKNWFNGLQTPAIVVRRLSGKTEVVRKFGYTDFKGGL